MFFNILATFAEFETITDLAESFEISRPTVHRVLGRVRNQSADNQR